MSLCAHFIIALVRKFLFGNVLASLLWLGLGKDIPSDILYRLARYIVCDPENSTPYIVIIYSVSTIIHQHSFVPSREITDHARSHSTVLQIVWNEARGRFIQQRNN